MGISHSRPAQVTGQPSVLYYVTEIFEDYDLGVGASIGLSAWKLVATMLTVRLIDSYGRVPLLQRGSAIMIADPRCSSGTRP